MKHQPKENFHANDDSYDFITHNTRSKRRDIKNDTPSPSNQASISGFAYSTLVKSVQPNVASQKRQDMGNKKSNEP